MNIRLAQPSDAPILCRASKTIAANPGRLVSHPDEIKLEDFFELIEKLNTKGKGIFIVAEDAGAIVGHALLDPMPLNATAHIMRLTIAVHEGHQAQGIGQLMMEHLIDWAKATSHVEKIELHVRATNQRAIALYQRMGFVEEGRLKHRIKISDTEYLDDLTMGLILK